MNILYIFPTNRHQIYQQYKREECPSTFLYGLGEMKRAGRDVHFQDTTGTVKKIIKHVFLPIEYLFIKMVGISLHFDHVFSQLSLIKRADLVISTSDATSIPILILKKIGVLKKQRIICMSVDLINREMSLLVIGNLKLLYQQAGKIIVFSKEEEKIFKGKMGLDNVHWVRLGIDTEFFRKHVLPTGQKGVRREYVLTIGRDKSRDYNLFLQIVQAMENMKFVAICSPKNLRDKTIPRNLTVIYNADYQTILRWLGKAFCFILPMRELHRASGQIAFLEAAALEMPIVVSNVKSLKDNYSFNEKDGVFFLMNSDKRGWTNMINRQYNKQIVYQDRAVPPINNLVDELLK